MSTLETWFSLIPPHVLFTTMLVLFFVLVGVLLLALILLLICSYDQVGKFFSSNPEINDFEEMRNHVK
jgi:hypothetical protein